MGIKSVEEKEKAKITCLKCANEKPRKEFQRDSQEFKSCNECCYGLQILIDNQFKIAVDLFDLT